jgi:transposase InsO family protein
VIYRLIAQWPAEASVARLCELLGVSRSGYYEACRRYARPAKVCPVSVHLIAAFEASEKAYGSRRLRQDLLDLDIDIGLHHTRTLMKRHQLKAVWKRKFIHTTDSRHDLPIAENLLDRQFNPAGPNQAWVSDITYIRTRSGWLYLAVVLDLFARKVVGWAMAPNMPAELVCTALQMAIAQRNPPAGLIVHSDRGSQYASAAHRALLAEHGLLASMSRKGNCWDNAVMERFFLNLKMERVWRQDYANHGEAIIDIADYIVGFYNSRRRHSTLGYVAPNLYELNATAH